MATLVLGIGGPRLLFPFAVQGMLPAESTLYKRSAKNDKIIYSYEKEIETLLDHNLKYIDDDDVFYSLKMDEISIMNAFVIIQS